MPAEIPQGVPEDEIAHVYPVDDLRDHIIDSRGACWCRPTIDHHPGGYCVVHNSMDGREDFETGKRKPS